MSFEEEFPGLKHRKIKNPKSNRYYEADIQIYCLDKKRVRKAIDKDIPLDEKDAASMILNDALKKELGL